MFCAPVIFSCSTPEEAREIIEKIEDVQLNDDAAERAQRNYAETMNAAVDLVERILSLGAIIKGNECYKEYLESGPASPLSIADAALSALKEKLHAMTDTVISINGTLTATLPATDDVSITTDLPQLTSQLTTYIKRCIEEHGTAH